MRCGNLTFRLLDQESLLISTKLSNLRCGVTRLSGHEFHGELAITNPWTGTLIGGSVQVNVDRKLNWYVGVGPTAGKSATVLSASLTAGWLLEDEKPNEDRLQEFLTGHSFNVAGGFFGGGGITHTPGVGTAIELGLFSPQAGASYHHSDQLDGE